MDFKFWREESLLLGKWHNLWGSNRGVSIAGWELMLKRKELAVIVSWISSIFAYRIIVFHLGSWSFISKEVVLKKIERTV